MSAEFFDDRVEEYSPKVDLKLSKEIAHGDHDGDKALFSGFLNTGRDLTVDIFKKQRYGDTCFDVPLV